jgi:acetyl-CoA decarbonylase/synthase complex subunit gamma
MVRIKDTESQEKINQVVQEVASYSVERVGMELKLDGFAIENDSKDGETFAKCVRLVKSQTDLPLVLMSKCPANINIALEEAWKDKPLIYAADKENYGEMAELAQKFNCPLAIYAPNSLDELADLVEKVNKMGIENIVLDPGGRGFGESLTILTQIRRLALKKSFRPFGYPIITFPGETTSSLEEAILAGQQVAKYAGVIVVDHFSPEIAYSLLTLRLNIYTDPQRPIQTNPGLYQIGAPDERSPLCVTTNFSLTYFSIAGELESSGWNSYLLVCDTEGLSVLTSWSAGKFDAEKIAKSIEEFDVAKKISHRRLILPGRVAIMRGEVEEELPDWEIMVGPPEAMDVGGYLKEHWLM